MQKEIIIAGFGGQGVLFAGQLLAYASMDQGLNVTWFPSYGPEMRGGTANCTVVISDEEVGSPAIRNPQICIVMNLPSLTKYEPLMAKGGLLVVDSSMTSQKVERDDIRVVYVPASKIAEEIGNKRMANMVVLSAMLTSEEVLPLSAIEKALEEHLPERHKKFLPMNFEALKAGTKYQAEPA